MAKVNSPFFPNGVGCLKFKPNKNLKEATHVVYISKSRKKREVKKIDS